LNILAVSPDHQKQTLGSKLVDAGLNLIDALSPPMPTLLKSSPVGYKLYTSKGFQPTGGFAYIEALGFGVPVMVRPARK
jgi:predicted N-acetyltransferase YhbS